MKNIRYGLLVLALLLSSLASAEAEVSIAIGLPNVSIGINLPVYPELAPVPGYPVYYAPGVDGNYFFYDGMYWVYQDDNWYASSWYNGPWSYVEPTVVPLFVLRVPVRYYRQPPPYFRGWRANAPPRWGQHWGRGWEQQRRGWDKWNRRSVPARAPRPVYQRQYSGDRYPHQVEQQHNVRSQQYRYQPRDKVVRQHYQQQPGQGRSAPAQRGRQEAPQMRNQQQQAPQRSPQHQQGAPAVQEHRQQPGAQQHQQQAPRAHEQEQRQQDKGRAYEPERGQGQGRNKDEDRGQGHNKDDDRGRGRDK